MRIGQIALLLLLLCFGTSTNLWSQTQDREVISLSDSIGPQIDSLEKETYHLFPDIRDFQKGQIVRLSESKLD